MSQTSFPQPNPEWLLTRGVLARRFLAFLADLLLISVVFWAAALFIAIFGLLTLGLGWLAFHILPWLPLLYFTLLVAGSGATPGQRVFGLRLRQDSTLLPPTMALALVWSLLLLVSIAFSFIPFLAVFTNSRHRAAHDLLSGLVIIRQAQIPY